MKRHKTVHEYLEEQSGQRISFAPAVSASLPEIIVDSPQHANEAHWRVVGHAQKLLLEIIAVGRYLTKTKAALGHGKWENWVRDNLDFATNTAWRYMQVYEKQDLLKPHDLHTLELNEAYKILSGKKTRPAVRSPSSKSKLTDKDGQQKRLTRFAHQSGITLNLEWPIKALDPFNREDPIEALLQLVCASLKENTSADRQTLLKAIVQAAQKMQADQTAFAHDLVQQLYAEEEQDQSDEENQREDQ